ncbi:hypothetical protein [Maritimibacter sp. UBA3975]|uniref:hypothetical protein n=1 Tax=Maritimibacter sp. UBA3975 TaxID=1946833 RepID=UPI000C0AC6AF|nr:hypothetical protein [Maritimibacter sp. UBA3975]MAM63578.1 hypothetical protein [Maritimibacter sp.]|tara:strand:- start:28964 stop:29185 length:222 start_codon:yes stop_codon:yes gene_type:complete
MRTVFFALALMLASPTAALAFCGGWNSPVAPGFDGSSWGEKWPVLAAILTFVVLFSTFVVRRVSLMRDMPEEA